MTTVAQIEARLVLIDLDGTLINTAPDLAASVNRMLQDLGRPGFPEPVVATWIGNGVKRLVKRALVGAMDGEPDGGLFERGYARFLAHYGAHVADLSRPYPGAAGALRDLRAKGLPLVCITNKAEAFTTPLLRALSLDQYFDLVLSGDTLARCKPDPLPLQYACEQFQVSPDDAVLVGDSENDIQAARAAGSAVICVRYGYNQGVDLDSLGPDLLVDSLSALPACIGRAAGS